MIASKLLLAIARVLELAESCGPDADLDKLVAELRAVQAELHAGLDEIDSAPDDVERLRAMQHWNLRAAWAELLVNALCNALKQPIPI
jgi:hypothetical protein